MKTGYFVGGVICAQVAVAQLYQLAGHYGFGSTIPGIGLAIATAVGAFLCFRKALASGNQF